MCGKIFVKIDVFFSEISAKLLQNALSRSVKGSFKGILDPDPEADEFQKLISSSPDWCLPVYEDW